MSDGRGSHCVERLRPAGVVEEVGAGVVEKVGVVEVEVHTRT